MSRFLTGVIAGFITFGIYTSFYPLGLRATISKLVELEHGDYDARTGKFILRECKKE